METHFLLAFGEEEFLAPLAMTGSEAFFNKLLEVMVAGARNLSMGCSTNRYETYAAANVNTSRTDM